MPNYRGYIVRSDDNSNEGVIDVEVAEDKDPAEAISAELEDHQAIGAVVGLAD